MCSLTQLIQSPTRVTINSDKIIDLIFTTFSEKHIDSGVIPVTMSDHYMVYTVIGMDEPIKQRKHIAVCKRNYSSLCINSFRRDIVFSSVFTRLLYCNDVNQAWDMWLGEFMKICDKHAPIHKHRIKNQTKPWVTPEIRQIIHSRNLWHKRAITYKNQTFFAKYRTLRNKVNLAKKFVVNEIQENEGKPDKAWKALKHLLPSKNKNISDSKLNANRFNNFFSSIGTKATDHFGDIILPVFDSLVLNNNFSFSEISIDYVQNALCKLSDSTTLDSLNTNTYLLRMSCAEIAPCLSHIFNLSLRSGIVPASWKTASVTPIYKGKGEKIDYGNYRPISIIPSVAKIIELFVKEQLVAFLQHNNLLTPSQFAYSKGVSTETALHTLVDDTLINVDMGKVTVACMLNLAKGFDTVCHEILLHKMHHYGIRGHYLNWFKSYLSGRLQYVKFNNSISNVQKVPIGVPQGTILGPILFLLYVNDFPKCFKNCKCVIYADYTTIYFASDKPDLLNLTIQDAFTDAAKWLANNRLVINVSKFQFITIGNPKRVENLNLSFKLPIISSYGQSQILNGSFDHHAILPSCTSTKLLGVVIDTNLSFKDHINNLQTKLAAKLGLLRRLSHVLPQKVLCSLFMSIIQPHIDYCLSVWGSCSQTDINSIQKLQNRAARIITKCFDYNISSLDLVKNLGWMSVEDRCNYYTSILIYKCLHNSSSHILSNRFTRASDSHCYITRYAENNNLQVPKPNSNYMKQA